MANLNSLFVENPPLNFCSNNEYVFKGQNGKKTNKTKNLALPWALPYAGSNAEQLELSDISYGNIKCNNHFIMSYAFCLLYNKHRY